MKKYLIPVFLSFAGLCIGSLITYFLISSNDKNIVETTENIQILRDPLFDQGTYLDYDLANIELMQTTPYIIEPNMSDGRKHVTIHFPTFFHQSSLQKKEFIKKLESLGTYQLYLNFSSREPIDIYRFNSLFWDLHNFNELSIMFYAYPQNYYELFNIIKWDNSADIDLSLWLFGPAYPYGFYVDAFIIHAKEMVLRNNKEVPIKSLRLYVTGLEGFSSSLFNDGENALKTFPTKSLWTTGITTSVRNWESEIKK
ncbi:hypothetical protein K2X92_04935 [Candidatus Gracilibacteria bacterium]|nr:hypothetical protein [Candidatus Gracilibacteria bacterium]